MIGVAVAAVAAPFDAIPAPDRADASCMQIVVWHDVAYAGPWNPDDLPAIITGRQQRSSRTAPIPAGRPPHPPPRWGQDHRPQDGGVRSHSDADGRGRAWPGPGRLGRRLTPAGRRGVDRDRRAGGGGGSFHDSPPTGGLD